MVTMMVHDWLTLIGIVFLVIAAIGIALIFLPVWGYAQDVDPCFIDDDMFKRICEQQEIDKVMESLLERAKEYNTGESGYCVSLDSGEYEYCMTEDLEVFSFDELRANKTVICNNGDCLIKDNK